MTPSRPSGGPIPSLEVSASKVDDSIDGLAAQRVPTPAPTYPEASGGLRGPLAQQQELGRSTSRATWADELELLGLL